MSSAAKHAGGRPRLKDSRSRIVYLRLKPAVADRVSTLAACEYRSLTQQLSLLIAEALLARKSTAAALEETPTAGE